MQDQDRARSDYISRRKLLFGLGAIGAGFTLFGAFPKKSMSDTELQETALGYDIKQFGAVGDGVTNDSAAFQSAFNLTMDGSKSIVIYVPDGNYLLSQGLIVYKNTTIIASDKAVLIRGHSSHMFTNAALGSLTNTGYEGNGNISLIGGTYEVNSHNFPNGRFFPTAHARDLLFKNIIVRNCGGHAHEIAGCVNVIFDGCRYEGYIAGGSYDPEYLECIQPDTMQQTSFPYFGAYDYTLTKNITIRNCYFGMGNDPVPGAVPWKTAFGNHGSYNGQVIENIEIEGCVFDGLSYSGVRPCKFKNITVRGNTFVNCARPIHYFINSAATEGCSGLYVENNKFHGTVSTEAIFIEGKEVTDFDDSHTMKSVTILNNEFELLPTTTAVHVKWCENVEVVGNRSTGGRRLAQVNSCRGATVTNNQGLDLSIGLALVQTNSVNVMISNNYTRNCGETAININLASQVAITNNVLRNNGLLADNVYPAIHVQGASVKGSITGNIISSESGISNLPSTGVRVRATVSGFGVFNNMVSDTRSKLVSNEQTEKYDFTMYDSNGDRYNVSVSTAGALVLTKI